MKLSKYLKIYQHEDDSEQIIVYSIKKSSKILIPKEFITDIQNGTVSDDEITLLKELDICVESEFDENTEMLSHIKDLNKANTELDITIALTLDCNFGCLYCFENEVKGEDLYMTEETEGHVVRFIRDKITDSINKVRICFYGGEPLMAMDRLISISTQIRSCIEEKGGMYTGTMISNGSLLTRNTAEALVDAGVTSLKLTLDGPPEFHNTTRPFLKGGGPTFDVILKNLKETCDIIDIEVGGNYDQETFREYVKLLDILEKEGLSPDRLDMVNFGPVMKKPVCEKAFNDYEKGHYSYTEPWVIEAEQLLREETLKRGYNTPKPKPFTCIIDNENAFIINYDGGITKCQGFIGKKDYEVGNVRTGITNYSERFNLDMWKTDECLNCTYLPMCFGGCRYMSYSRTGDAKQLDCRKDYFDACLETQIKQDMKYRE